MSIPERESDSEAALMLPARVRLNVAASAACLGVAGLYGVMQCVNGLRTVKAVWKEDGTARGSADIKGESRDGDEWCRDLMRIQSALVLCLSFFNDLP